MDIDDIVKNGLRSTPKHLPSWYRYDKKGLQLFNRCLTENNHYYMYTSEIDLLQVHVQDIVAEVPGPTVLVDMGSGNCVKSRMIIDALLERQARLQFIPVDISKEFLLKTAEKISDDYGNKIDVHPIAAEYGEGIEHLRTIPGNKLIVWLGGGFQNQPYRVQVERIERLAQVMSENDRLMISLDVTQNVEMIKLAYLLDDAGVWENFYKNSFWRLNRDYGSNIDTDKLDIDVGYIERKDANLCSYVTVKARANEQQTYDIPGLHISLSLKKDECIRLYDGEGTSCKYTVKQIQTLVQAGNQLLEKCWVDQKRHVAICCIAKKKCIDEWHIVEEDKGKDERTDNSSENRKAKVTKNYNTVSIG